MHNCTKQYMVEKNIERCKYPSCCIMLCINENIRLSSSMAPRCVTLADNAGASCGWSIRRISLLSYIYGHIVYDRHGEISTVTNSAYCTSW